MKPMFVILAACAALVSMPALASAPEGLEAGKMLHTADGKRLAPIYRVRDDGSVQIILNGKMVVVPAESITVADGKASTQLGRPQLLASR